ncbi:MAG: hypothetical protein J6S19_03285 [Lentisphaeria bacterium]|nr:hypothetical protein [Lentisphaeria bacterium]
MQNTVFLGIKHCGKSTQGMLLAKRLNWKFIDSDTVLTEVYMTRYKTGAGDAAPRAVMKRHGEEFFRKFEAEVMQMLIADNDSAPAVLALGGGVPDNPFLEISELKKLGTMVYLEVAPEEAFKRIAAGGIPPFLAGDDPFGKFQELYQKRSPRYEALADLTVKVEPGTAAPELNEKIYQLLKSRNLLEI